VVLNRLEKRTVKRSPVPSFLAVLLLCTGGCDIGRGTSRTFYGAAGRSGDDAGQDSAVETGPPPADAGDATPPTSDAGEVLGPVCDEVPAAHAANGVTLSFSIRPVLAGKPFVFGEPNPLPSGGTILPLNFRFYVSRVALFTAGGGSVSADLVDASGALEPYGTHLFIAEQPDSQVLRVRVPAGSYSGLSFLLGLEDGCNAGSPFGRKFPLNDESQMSWQHTGGYLFLRLEDQVMPAPATDGGADASADAAVADAGTPAIPPQIHMGGFPGQIFAPAVKVVGPLAAAAGSQKQLVLDVGAVIAGAQMDVAPGALLNPIPEPGVQVGEHLRLHVPELALFSFAP
jgi:hypothetical protein